MNTEEKIKQELTGKFAFLQDSIVIKRERRILVDVALEKSEQVFDYLVKQGGFSALSAITGLDEGAAIAVIYHLCKEGSIILNLKVRLSRENPAINTVTPYFPSAEVYERELMDLLGIKVSGLAAGHRYPLPDTFPQNEFPLRKDWKGTFGQKEEESKNA